MKISFGVELKVVGRGSNVFNELAWLFESLNNGNIFLATYCVVVSGRYAVLYIV